nr:olfactory receptor 18 [Gregopimpla kuwanae]
MSVHNKVTIENNNFTNDRESDINYVLQYTKFFLRCIGIWPLVSSNSTKIEKAASKFVIPYCSVTMCLLILPISLHLTMRDVGTTETILLLGPFCHSSTDIIEHFILIFHWDLIKYGVQQLENDWRGIESQNDREIAMRNIKVGRSMSFMCAFGMYSSGVFYVVLMPLCSGNTINEFNETVRPLIYPGNDIMIDLQNGYNYEIVFCNNCIATFLHFTVVNAIFNLASIFVTHACGQMQIIMSRLESLVEETDVTKTQDRISFIIRRHVSILKFSLKIDKLLREICLIEVVASTINICMLEYYCLLEWRNGNKLAVITYGIVLVSMVFNILIYCYVGELLKEKCEEIGKAAYMIEWYKLSGKEGLALVMILIISNNPRKLTAGQIIELSIATFCNIVKSSFAYLGILQAVADQ